MSKSLLTALLAVACSGCALVTPADYRDSFATSSGAQVRGQLVDQTDLKIYIDGEKVVDDRLSLLSGDGQFSGRFKGQPVSADCSTAASGRTTSCAVRVGRDSQTLRF